MFFFLGGVFFFVGPGHYKKLEINGAITYNPYKWPYKRVTGVTTPTSGVVTLLITGRGPL